VVSRLAKVVKEKEQSLEAYRLDTDFPGTLSSGESTLPKATSCRSKSGKEMW
jgi:hypothetical protein